MQFILQKERQEAERKRIEAEGVRDANKIISEGLTPQVLKYKSLEVYLKLSESPNTKIIVGEGLQPMLMME